MTFPDRSVGTALAAILCSTLGGCADSDAGAGPPESTLQRGVGAAAKIVRDDLGIPHVLASSEASLVEAYPPFSFGESPPQQLPASRVV